MRRLILAFLLAAATSVALLGQATNIHTSGTLPTNCTVGNVYLKTGSSSGFYICLATDTWSWISSGAPMSVSVLTSGSAATYTVPAGVYQLRVRVVGGGGGGGGGDGAVTPTAGAGGGGLGGAYAEERYTTTPGATFRYSIGALGAGGTAGNNSGTQGGATTFDELGTVITANGGPGGTSMAAGTSITATTAGTRATATAGDINISGSQGNRGWRFSSTIVFSGTGGDSPLGSGGIGGNNSVGQNGGGYGAGGGGGLNSGTGTNRAGGDGTAGVIIVEEYGGPTVGSSTPSTLYVATTGNDTTGDGTSGAPYLTVAKALTRLPSVITQEYVIDIADGTYAGSISVTTVTSSGAGKIRFTGDTTTPANVSFTGNTSHVYRNGTIAATIGVFGPVVVEVEGIRVNATTDAGIYTANGAHVIVDRDTITGTLLYGVFNDRASVEFKGNVTASGWTTYGISGARGASYLYTSAGTLTLTGPGTSGTGVQMTGSTTFHIYSTSGTGLNITITGVLYGFAVAFQSSFTHQAGSSTITIDNASTPGTSAGILLTDLAGWSTNQALTLDNFTNGFELNSTCYAEQTTGTRTFTNLGSTSSAVQNSTVYLP